MLFRLYRHLPRSMKKHVSYSAVKLSTWGLLWTLGSAVFIWSERAKHWAQYVCGVCWSWQWLAWFQRLDVQRTVHYLPRYACDPNGWLVAHVKSAIFGLILNRFLVHKNVAADYEGLSFNDSVVALRHGGCQNWRWVLRGPVFVFWRGAEYRVKPTVLNHRPMSLVPHHINIRICGTVLVAPQHRCHRQTVVCCTH